MHMTSWNMEGHGRSHGDTGGSSVPTHCSCRAVGIGFLDCDGDAPHPIHRLQLKAFIGILQGACVRASRPAFSFVSLAARTPARPYGYCKRPPTKRFYFTPRARQTSVASLAKRSDYPSGSTAPVSGTHARTPGPASSFVSLAARTPPHPSWGSTTIALTMAKIEVV